MKLSIPTKPRANFVQSSVELSKLVCDFDWILFWNENSCRSQSQTENTIRVFSNRNNNLSFGLEL